MRLLLYSIIILLSLSVFGSCGCHDYDERLLRAESIIFDSPDSSLLILDSISPDELTRENDRALYALLLTETLEKLHLNPTDDSLISIAADYYDNHTDVERQVRAHYYRGIVQCNNTYYTNAIVNFFQSRDIAIKNGLYFWAGMSNRGIADIYNTTYNAAEELSFAKQELENIIKSGRQPYINYALLDLAVALCSTSKWNESNEILKEILDSANIYNDAYLQYCATQLNIQNLILSKRYDEVSGSMLSIIMNPKFSEASDTCFYCHVLIETGRFNDTIIQILENLSNEDIIYKNFLNYKIAEIKGDFKGVVENGELVYNNLNAEFRSCMSHTLSTSVTGFYDLKVKHSEAELEISRFRNYLSMSIAIAIVTLVVYIAFIIYRHQRQRIEEKVLLAEQLQEDLNKSRESNTSNLDIVRKVMTEKYRLIDELSSIVLYTSDTRAARRKIADTVTEIINDLTIGRGKIAQFEDEVNENYDNLFSDFKIDLPNLKDADYRLFLFSVLGLSNSVISLFLKEDKIEAVYNRRRRLKMKIKSLSSEKRDLYMRFL